ncbi:clavaminate synthase family protein [Streptomyces sp. HD]|uniref:clavaminate synthase family protein n=1 Tax=Streptomyces sp. HD TaxID=3020892 RepID=UPI00232EA825|nr:clavaminate synthase family protein [Streptomyces sp. HD]MDC0773772.1 clavaminate synthase family protein [Streptomyces sp. HD]
MSTGTLNRVEDHMVVFDDAVMKAVRDTSDRVLRAAGGPVDGADWIAAAGDAWHHLPVELRQVVSRFRRHSGEQGVLLLRGLPFGDDALPDTPATLDSVQSEPSVSAAVLMMIAGGLGDPAAFRPEKNGALVQNVVPVPGNEDVQGNPGSVELTFHTENAFHEHCPDYVLLMCLRSDHEGVAGLRTSCVRQILPMLSWVDREALSRTDYLTTPPPSFGGGNSSATRHSVLVGDLFDPDLRVDFAATAPQSAQAELAMAELESACEAAALTFRLRPGDLAIVDNRVTLHGRTAYRPRYDGRDRWLQRTFVLTDLRCSRRHRPHDGNVLVR